MKYLKMNLIYFQIKFLFRLLIENKPFKKINTNDKYKISFVKNNYSIN